MSNDNVRDIMSPLQLRYSAASPFVRKVLVFAHETGLADRIELAPTDVWAPDSDILRDNPLGRVPALIAPDGTFIGSTLCCEYLDTLHSGPHLIPVDSAERWPILQLHALADGIMEAAVAHVIEQLRRPAAFIYDGYLERQRSKISSTLDAVEIGVSAFRELVNLATITLACALGYLDFRLPQLEWRRGRPELAQWETVFSARPSLLATPPHL
jgi:glutathione S-transferase